MAGKAIAMSEVPDPVFSGKILGKGCVIWPKDDTAAAPADGTVIVVMGHTVGLSCADGAEILVASVRTRPLSRMRASRDSGTMVTRPPAASL